MSNHSIAVAEQEQSKITPKEVILIVLQLSLFLLSRILDDMTWYSFDVYNEQTVFEAVAIAGLALSAVVQVIRKCNNEGWFMTLFVRSQIKFMISWALITTIILIFFTVFTCEHSYEDSSLLNTTTNVASFTLLYSDCCLNAAQIFLTNLSYSLICNELANKAEMIVLEMVMFGQIIFNGNLLIILIHHLEESQKDESILMISLIIANQILMMDLIFRAAHLDEKKESKILHTFASHEKTKSLNEIHLQSYSLISQKYPPHYNN